VTERRLAVALVVVAVAICAGLAFAPTGRTSSCDTTGACVEGTYSLVEHEGPSVLDVLAIPVLAAVALAVVRHRGFRIAGAVALSVLTVLGALSIGLFIAPITAMAWGLVAYSSGASSAAK
jgi:hypothetical protein